MEIDGSVSYLGFGDFGFAREEANRDMACYEDFRRGVIPSSDKQKVSMRILFLLDSLGYPMNKLGTFLYKDLIYSLYEFVVEIDKTHDIDKYKKMVRSIKNPFCAFYHCIAREDKDMGVKSFHATIEEAIGLINDDMVDEGLAMKIFGSRRRSFDYGQQALLLARFVAGQYEFVNGCGYKKPVIRGLKFDKK